MAIARCTGKPAGGRLRLAALPLALTLSLGAFAESSDLVELYTEALGSDPRLMAADAEADIYQAREKYRRGALLPQVSGTAQGTRTGRESPGTGGDYLREYYDGEKYSLSLTQSLYNKPQWEGYRAARNEADQYAARFEDTENLITVDLVERYTKVLAAEDNLRFVVAEREAAEKQYSQIKARFERQLAMITDVLEVEARVDRLRTEELSARNQVKLTREAMSEMVGREVAEPLAPLREQIFVDWELSSPDPWIERGLNDNSALQAARLSVKAAEAGLRQAKGGRHPTANLQLLAQKSDIGYENAQVPTNEVYVAALNLNVPLFSGGQVSAQVAEARARLRLATQQMEEVERGLRKQIREAFLNAQSASERVVATRKAVASAEKSYEARQKGYQYGTVTVVDVLDAAENLYGAQRDYRQAYYDLMVQGMNLYRTAGSDAPAKVAEINGWLATDS
ncbi:MAG: TolC family outer membrane protein [Porticoccaceae bacterium]|jgi:outer membrane protein|nr:TolC family outer membrane protein [Porticoccaceae bacterium]HLS98977.1 TolC family outer membrane protein [Porticoccaceae bacterium]